MPNNLDGKDSNSSIRVLVADDFVPFRHFVASTLRQLSQLRIIGEASDGIEAVEKAQELHPDLVLLDISLPRLNGIEAGRRIFARFPRCKILFISQEISIDIVRGAFSIGASGYIAKMDAASELLIAISAVLRGEFFIGSRLAGNGLTDIHALERKGVHRHEVAFYAEGRLFLDDLAQLVQVVLEAGKTAVAILTELHQNDLASKLHSHDLDFDKAVEQGRYVYLNADEAISAMMLNGVIDSVRCLELFGDLIVKLRRGKSSAQRIAIFGEGVNLLCSQGKFESAIRVEKLCNQLIETYDLDIRCAYFLSNIPEENESHIFQQICVEHSTVLPQGFSVGCT